MIHKITTSWIKSVVENTLTSTFTDAWSNVINALNGTWGDIDYRPLKGVENVKMNVLVLKSRFSGSISTELEGEVTVVFPYTLKDFGKIVVEEFVGNEVVGVSTYLEEYSGSLTPNELMITLPSGKKLITISGTARRI